MEKQFTATVYILHEDKVLLHPHPKLGKWLPPGGHLEKDETPIEAARREVLEETGLEIAFIEQENIKINGYNAVSFPRPFLCLLENIPAHNNQAAHQHMDFIYLAMPLVVKPHLAPFQWVGLADLQTLDVFPDTREVLQLILGNHQRRRCLSCCCS